jgi:drug/metabolite transporter (DMT)-like permease
VSRSQQFSLGWRFTAGAIVLAAYGGLRLLGVSRPHLTQAIGMLTTFAGVALLVREAIAEMRGIASTSARIDAVCYPAFCILLGASQLLVDSTLGIGLIWLAGLAVMIPIVVKRRLSDSSNTVR